MQKLAWPPSCTRPLHLKWWRYMNGLSIKYQNLNISSLTILIVCVLRHANGLGSDVSRLKVSNDIPWEGEREQGTKSELFVNVRNHWDTINHLKVCLNGVPLCERNVLLKQWTLHMTESYKWSQSFYLEMSPLRKATLIALLSIFSIWLFEKLNTLLLPENP